jgi:hypothetical protein
MIDNRYAAVSWLLSAVVLFEHSVTLVIMLPRLRGAVFFALQQRK